MDHACAHRTLVKENAGPRVSLDIAVLVDSEFSHANDEGFDENAYAYYESDVVKAIGSSNKISVEQSIFNSTSTKIQIQLA
jgi:hypothetical protein